MAILETILSAGFTGLVGNAISTVFSFVNQKQKNKHEAIMKELDIKAMIREAEMNIQVTEAKVQGDIALAEMASFNESIKQNAIDKLAGKTLERLFDSKWTAPFGVIIALLFGLVDFLKALIRPGVTLYMTIATTWIYFQALKVVGEQGFDPQTSLALFDQITNTVLYVFVSVVLWWFGERRVAKTLNRTNGWKK